MKPPPFDRLHFGCGPNTVAGWTNVDLFAHPGLAAQVDLPRGLPFEDGAFRCAVGLHVLQDLAWPDLPPALTELRRVLRAGGRLRLGLPDLDRAIAAYQRGDAGYFHVPDEDARSLGGKLVTQLIWYGSVRTPFTFDFAAELLGDAGFHAIERCTFGTTRGEDDSLASLDNRERESLFIEAMA